VTLLIFLYEGIGEALHEELKLSENSQEMHVTIFGKICFRIVVTTCISFSAYGVL
jgi:hypothetical protein